MYCKPSRRFISRVFEKGSVREAFLRLIIAPKSICSCMQGKQTNGEKVKISIHVPVAHTGTHRGMDTCILMAEGREHREKMTINRKSYLHFFSVVTRLTHWIETQNPISIKKDMFLLSFIISFVCSFLQ